MQTLLNDFEARLRLAILTANEPFLFYTDVGKECYTGVMAWSLKGFVKALNEVDLRAIEFHVSNGDFESWAQNSLRDKKLATELKKIKDTKENGEKLRETILNSAKQRYTALQKQIQDATELF